MILEGKRLLITGVVNDDSIAFATAARAQELGAEIALSARSASFFTLRRGGSAGTRDSGEK